MKRFLLLNSALFFIAITVFLFFTQTHLFAASTLPSVADETVSIGQSGKVDPGFGNNGTGKYIIPPIKPSPDFLGQNHFYTVTFRGNGEAVVNFKAIISNLEDKDLTGISLRVPKIDPKDVMVYQVSREPQCLRYKSWPQAEVQKELQNGKTYEEELQQQTNIYPLPTKSVSVCEEYQQPDYFQYWYGKAEYKKATFTLEGDTILITLPEAIKSNSSGSYFINYRAFGYAKKNLLGAYHFAFETLKVNDRINQLQVGIATDSDLVLRDAQGKVNYRFEDSASMLKSAQGETGIVKSPQFDQFLNQIGQGSINKTSSNLQPLESYTVKGVYADSWYKLYGKEVLIGIFIFIIIIALVVVILKFLIRFVHQYISGITSTSKKSALNAGGLLPILSVFGFSLSSSIIVLIYTLILYFILQNMNFWFSSDAVNMIIFIMLIIISAGIYGLVFLIPAIIMGIKRGVWWGVGTLILTLGWLLFYLSLIFIFLYISNSNSYPYPSPTFSKPVPMRTSIEK